MSFLRALRPFSSATSMSFSRFEAFSDGVFAIAITLLVIEIERPDLAGVTPAQAVERLWHVWPHLLSYVTSFFVIGVIWLNHHALFRLLPRVDRLTLTLNLLLLMCVAFVPFPTALLGQYGGLQPVVIFYGAALAVLGLMWNLLWWRVVRHYLTQPDARAKSAEEDAPIVPRAALLAATRWGIAWPVAYTVAALLSFLSTTLSLVLYAAIPLFYLLPSALDRETSEQT